MPSFQSILSSLELAIPVAKVASQLRKAVKNQVVPVTTLQSFEAQLESVVHAWPEVLQSSSTSYLDPNMLWLATAIPCMSLLLHRHNLTPVSTNEERASALDSCRLAAQATAHLVSRTFLQHPTTQTDSYIDPARASLSWEQRVGSMTIAHLCVHLWRSALILCLCLDFNSAATCAHLSTAIGNKRKINVACSHNMVFFLMQLSDRLNNRKSPEGSRGAYQAPGSVRRPVQVEEDEEMIAYATGDLQGDARGSWVWTGLENDQGVMDVDSKASTQERRRREGGSGSSEKHTSRSPRLDETNDEWPRVMSLLHNLRPYQRRHPPRLSSAGSSGDSRSRSGYSPGSSKRISIANII